MYIFLFLKLKLEFWEKGINVNLYKTNNILLVNCLLSWKVGLAGDSFLQDTYISNQLYLCL